MEKNSNNQVLKWDVELNREYSKKERKMAEKLSLKYSTSLNLAKRKEGKEKIDI